MVSYSHVASAKSRPGIGDDGTSLCHRCGDKDAYCTHTIIMAQPWFYPLRYSRDFIYPPVFQRVTLKSWEWPGYEARLEA